MIGWGTAVTAVASATASANMVARTYCMYIKPTGVGPTAARPSLQVTGMVALSQTTYYLHLQIVRFLLNELVTMHGAGEEGDSHWTLCAHFLLFLLLSFEPLPA